MRCPDGRRLWPVGVQGVQVGTQGWQSHSFVQLSSLQQIVDAGLGIFGHCTACMVHRRPVLVCFVNFRAVVGLNRGRMSRNEATVLLACNLGEQRWIAWWLLVKHRHSLVRFATRGVCAAWAMSAIGRESESGFFLTRRSTAVLLKLTERRRPKVDFIFLFAVGGSDIGADEAAEEDQADKHNGPCCL